MALGANSQIWHTWFLIAIKYEINLPGYQISTLKQLFIFFVQSMKMLKAHSFKWMYWLLKDIRKNNRLQEC